MANGLFLANCFFPFSGAHGTANLKRKAIAYLSIFSMSYALVSFAVFTADLRR
jgi:hypothetical protein